MNNLSKSLFYFGCIVLVVLLFAGTGCSVSSSIAGGWKEKLKKGEDIVFTGQSFKEDIDLTELLNFRPSTPGVKRAIVNSNLIFENCSFASFIASAQKEDDLYIIEFRGDVVFINCVFKNIVELSYCTFDREFSVADTEFIEPFKANNALFLGRTIYFNNAIFYSNASFNGAVFSNNTSFFKTSFRENVFFQRTSFNGNSYWGAALFDGYAEFGSAIFKQNLHFGEAKFIGRTNFSGMTVAMNANFSTTHFNNHADFSNVVFLGDADTRDALLNKD